MGKETKKEIVEEVKKEKKQRKIKISQVITKKRLALATVILMILVLFGITKLTHKEFNTNQYVDSELLRARTYEQFEEGSENIEGTDNVKFSSFFLRDLDGDGYAEKIKGTCKQIGKEDTLYMEIIVQTEGYLKNAKIQIDGKNFYMQTALPKDDELKENYIGTNIKTIEFENLQNGTQKLLTGVVRSGDYSYDSKKMAAIGNNINNYSRQDNKIVLTGTYVDENENETEISKEIYLEMDWYGTTKTTINNLYQNFTDLEKRVNEEDKYIELNFQIRTDEINNELLIRKNHIEASIPLFNGYKPTSVIVNNSNVYFNYNESISKLIIERTAKTDGTGLLTSTVSRTNTFEVSVKYPLEAYEKMEENSVELLVTIQEFYEGFNNTNAEFDNPYKSNIAETIIRAVYNKSITTGNSSKDYVSIIVGEFISEPYHSYVISKRKPMKIYNGTSLTETNDTYISNWYYYKGEEELEEKIILKETPNNQSQVSDQVLDTSAQYTSMESFVAYKGIYFSNLTDVISENGEIKVYDEELNNLLLTVDKKNLKRYTQNNPFYYETPVNHVRVEISGMNKCSSLNIYNVKELDDEYITNNYTEEEFSSLKQIKSNLVAYRGTTLIGNVSRNALYEIPISIATISLSKNVISTQTTEKDEIITIKTEYNQSKNEVGWINGTFLIKIPDEIIDVNINSVVLNGYMVSIKSYEYIENSQGKFIKIYTSNNIATQYTITINCMLTPDPRVSSLNKVVELYASNEEGTGYYFKAQDIYDVNGNGKYKLSFTVFTAKPS